MALKEQIDTDIKEAMKSQNVRKREVLRFVKSEITRAEGGLKTYGDKEIVSLIKKAIENLKTIDKPESQEEIEILETYLPAQLSEAQLREIVGLIVLEVGANSTKDIGKIMTAFNAKYAGQADGKLLAQIVKENLS